MLDINAKHHDSSEQQEILDLVPLSKLKLSLYDNISILEMLLEGKTFPEEEGIYLVNGLKPLMKAGQPYFTLKGLKSNKPIIGTEFNNLKEDILDINGNIVISKAVMLKKENILRNKPVINTRVMKIAELLIKENVERLCPVFSTKKDIKEEIFKYLLPMYHELYFDNTLQQALDDLFIIINEFIGKDRWNIYFVKINGFEIIIEKCHDYRIYWFTKHHFDNDTV